MRQKKADTETMGRGDTVKILSKISPGRHRVTASPPLQFRVGKHALVPSPLFFERIDIVSSVVTRLVAMSRMRKIDRQREHQANERTFLAWLRTSIALIGFGFAIARFGLFLRQLNFVLTQREAVVYPLFNSENLGIIFVVFGIVAIALAAWRYNQVFWEIERGDYRPQRLPVWIMTGVVIILGVLSLPLLLLRNGVSPRPSTVPHQLPSGSFRDSRTHTP